MEQVGNYQGFMLDMNKIGIKAYPSMKPGVWKLAIKDDLAKLREESNKSLESFVNRQIANPWPNENIRIGWPDKNGNCPVEFSNRSSMTDHPFRWAYTFLDETDEIDKTDMSKKRKALDIPAIQATGQQNELASELNDRLIELRELAYIHRGSASKGCIDHFDTFEKTFKTVDTVVQECKDLFQALKPFLEDDDK